MTLIINGDCLEELRAMPDNSVDAVITDPPYGLSNTTPVQVAETIAAWVTGDREHVPAVNGGFMGAAWDSFVPPPAVWDECHRVLKPGGHMAVFSGTRTIGLMDMSIRLAGFDHRDTIGAGLMAWVTGQGFPKSQDISKAIDKARDQRHADALAVTIPLAEAMKVKGLTRRDLNIATGRGDNGAGSAQSWTTVVADGAHKPRVPTIDQWAVLRDMLDLHHLDAEVWRLNGNKGKPGENWDKREVVGRGKSGIGTAFGDGQWAQGKAEEFDITAPATDEARKWEGWGTQLKPSWEPILLYRKPLSERTVAANVVKHGTGAINVDATRIGIDQTERDVIDNRSGSNTQAKGWGFKPTGETFKSHAQGRFPANVVLDRANADRLDQQSGTLKSGTRKAGHYRGIGYMGSDATDYPDVQGSEGGASRFFHVAENLDHLDAPFKYCPKAPKKERPSYVDEDGATVQHATVKPLSIMSWLVRLLTPPGGVVLDPFAGSGTTVEAALLEGMNPIGIEAHTPYIPLIHQRVARATATPDALPIGDAA